jgi:hypothetical protein
MIGTVFGDIEAKQVMHDIFQKKLTSPTRLEGVDDE